MTMNPLALVAMGLALGVRRAADPDHVVAVAAPLSEVARRWRGGGRLLRLSTGALSLAFGAWLVYRIGWQDGLFLAAPHWTPR